MSDLKEQIIKNLQFQEIWSDDSPNVACGICLPLILLSGEVYTFILTRNPNNTFTISDNGWVQHELDCILFDHDYFPTEIEQLCKAYEVKRTGTHFTVTFPNADSRYAVKKFIDLIQFVSIAGNFGRLLYNKNKYFVEE